MDGPTDAPFAPKPSLELRVADLEAWKKSVDAQLGELERLRKEDRALIVDGLARLERAIVEGVDAMNVVGLGVRRDVNDLKDSVAQGVTAVESTSKAIAAECHRTNEMVAQLLAKGDPS